MGLAVLVHRKFGVEIPDFQICASDHNAIAAMFTDQFYSGKWIQLDTPEAPCVVTMSLVSEMPDIVTHIGTYIGDNTILHIHENRTSYTFKTNHPLFKNKILGYYKYEPD